MIDLKIYALKQQINRLENWNRAAPLSQNILKQTGTENKVLTLQTGSPRHVHGQEDLDGIPGVRRQLLFPFRPGDVWKNRRRKAEFDRFVCMKTG